MPHWMMNQKLRAPEGDADGGSGGGGSGGGDGPKYVTEEQLSNVVNAAVSTHVGRALKKTMAEVIPTIVEQVAAALKPGDGGDGGGDGGSGGGDGGGSGDGGKPDPDINVLKRRQTQLETQLTTERTAREAAEQGQRNDGLRSAVVKALGAHEITGERQEAAIASLYHTGRVKVADDGAHLYVDTNGDELPLVEGLKTWSGSDSAKLYLPPREVVGSGDSGGGRVPDLKVKDDSIKQAYTVALEGADQHLLQR